MSENLSDKEHSAIICGIWERGFLKEDVKEFIKRLKENGIQVKGEYGKYISFQILDRLAGEELIA